MGNRRRLGTEGIVSVEFSLLFGVLVIPTYLAAMSFGEVAQVWIDDLRADILQGQIDAIQLNCGALMTLVEAL